MSDFERGVMHAIDQLRARLCVLERTVLSAPIDHGQLEGLADDDHPQYHNDARGDARYLKLTGDTVSGDLTVTGGINGGTAAWAAGGQIKLAGHSLSNGPVLDAAVTGTGNWQRAVRVVNSNLGTGNKLLFSLGKVDGSTCNIAEIYYHHQGDGSDSNRLSMGFYGRNELLNIHGLGVVSVGRYNQVQATWYDTLVVAQRPVGDSTASIRLCPSQNSGRGWKIDVWDNDSSHFFLIYDQASGAQRYKINGSIAMHEMYGATGPTVATFGELGQQGVSILNWYPTVAFNSYHNGSGFYSKAAGYGGLIDVDQSNGSIRLITMGYVSGSQQAQTPTVRFTCYQSGQTAFRMPSTGGNVYTDWPGGWTGGIATYDICCTSIYYSGLSQRSNPEMKTDVTDFTPPETATARVGALRPIQFTWTDTAKRAIGLDIASVPADLCEYDETGKRVGYDLTGLVIHLVKAVQEIDGRMLALEERIGQ